jgi:hypothetical protein
MGSRGGLNPRTTPFPATPAGLCTLLAFAKLALSEGDAQAHCTQATVLAVVDNPWHIDNEERSRPIVWCRLRAPLGQLWKSSFATARL